MEDVGGGKREDDVGLTAYEGIGKGVEWCGRFGTARKHDDDSWIGELVEVSWVSWMGGWLICWIVDWSCSCSWRRGWLDESTDGGLFDSGIGKESVFGIWFGEDWHWLRATGDSGDFGSECGLPNEVMVEVKVCGRWGDGRRWRFWEERSDWGVPWLGTTR